MKLYGIDVYGKSHTARRYSPGHDLFPREKYSSRRSDKAHRAATKLAHRLGRHIAKYRLNKDIRNDEV